ncbi:sugar ABC transporter permease [Actinomadura miaoliensis]|uniref:Sugar ABC transporter permease n=1 Tax=Actinomadura miaoliensis TaxID=430685 RepID=A0ABP7VKQ1_9ACTN
MLPYLLLAPALAAELVVHIVPMLVGAWMSLLELTQFFIRNWTRAPYAGLANYRVAVDLDGPVGQDLLRSFAVTVAVTAVVVAGSWLLGLAAAVLLDGPVRGRAWLRTLFLVPYALPVFTAVITWRFMFQRDTGLVNAVLGDQLHLVDGHPFWLLGNNSFVALVVVQVWRMWPFAFLVFTAGLQSVPADLHEAAAIDGAGYLRRLSAVTLPLLSPINRVLLLVLFLWTFNDFNVAYTLFDRPPEAADVISIHIYNASFLTWNFGLGSAMSVLLLAFLLLVSLAYLVLGARGRRGHA